jgi:hypothetical protein
MRRGPRRSLSAEKQLELDRWVKGPAAAARAAVGGAADDRRRKELMEQNKAVYQSLRGLLLWLFRDKCAYCEVDYRSATVQVDHFRPKAKVNGDDSHPGYYWLMFDPANLIPSCSLCNNHKRNKFPISGLRAMNSADDLTTEQPELLNPHEDENIDAHLTVIADESDPLRFGMMMPVNGSPRGLASIKTYGLNNQPKIQARQMEMRIFRLELKEVSTDPARRRELILSLNDGTRQCSLACAAVFRAWREALDRDPELRG